MLFLRVLFSVILSRAEFRVSKKAMFLELVVSTCENEVAYESSFYVLEFTFHRCFLELAIIGSEKFWSRVKMMAIGQTPYKLSQVPPPPLRVYLYPER